MHDRAHFRVAVAVLLALAGTRALADEEAGADPVRPAPFAGWRAGLIATAAVNGAWDATGTLGLGIYPWRWAGFELRRVYTGAKAGTFSLQSSGAAVPGPGPGNAWVEGATTELAFLVRLGGFEPWVAAGRWSGQASTSGSGGGIDPCIPSCRPDPPPSAAWTQRTALAPTASLAAGVRYQWEFLLLGLEARQVLFGARTARIEPMGLDVPLRGGFLGLSLGISFGGPVEQGR